MNLSQRFDTMLTAKLPHDLVARLHAETKLEERFGAELQWPEEEVRMAVCQLLGIPLVAFAGDNVDLAAFERLRDWCLRLRFLPTFAAEIILCIVTPEPFNQEAIRAIKRETHKELRVLGCTERDFDRAISQAETDCQAIVIQRQRDNPIRNIQPADTWPIEGRNQLLTAEALAQAIVQNAFETGACDIQIEPQVDQIDIRFLYGTVWEPMPPLERKFLKSLIEAFQHTAGLTSMDAPPFQSGLGRYIFGGPPNKAEIDLRIEIFPCSHGLGLSARVLDSGKASAVLGGLPFEGEAKLQVENVLALKNGLVLVVGPTGSGKTTLLCRLLRQLNSTDKNIRTAEDPPEYSMKRVTQIEVGANVNRTFTQALHSLLRQKPDVIMVGEIRADDVAQTANEAALTGQMVFATLHAEDGPGAILRLLEMGVKPFVLQSTIRIVIAQRLVEELCPNCRRSEPITPQQAAHYEMYGMPAPAHTCKRVGCRQCNNRGFIGKVAIYEVFYPDTELREMIRPDVRASEVRKAWMSKGGIPMVAYGLGLVAAGRVPWEEVRAYETNPIPLRPLKS